MGNQEQQALLLQALQAFVAERQRLPHPKEQHAGLDVGAFANRMRRAHANGRLGPRRVKELQAIPRWDWALPSPSSQGFATHLEALQAFVAQHQRLPKPGEEVDGMNLGKWCNRCRRLRSEGKLAPEQAAALEEVAGWVWGPAVIIKALQAFTAEHGRLPKPKETHAGMPLAQAAGRLRRQHANGKLAAQWVAALEQQVPGWSWKPAPDAFASGLVALEAFVAQQGRLPGPKDSQDGLEVGKWANAQRRAHAKSTLGPKRVAALEAVPGWSWDPAGAAFASGLGVLQSFVEQQGRLPKPREQAEGVSVGLWASRQRRQHANGKLAPASVAALEAVPGFTWTIDKPAAGAAAKRAPSSEAFTTGLAALQHYLEQHQCLPKHQEEVDGFKLGAWANRMRRMQADGRLPPAWAAALDALPAWDWQMTAPRAPAKAEEFERSLAALQSFLARNKRLPKPKETYASVQVGACAMRWRRAHAKGKLGPKRIAALSGVNGWSWEAPPRKALPKAVKRPKV